MLKQSVCIFSLVFGCMALSSQKDSQDLESRHDRLFYAAKTGQDLYRVLALKGLDSESSKAIINKHFKDSMGGATPFLVAVAHGNELVAKILLRNGADVNAQDTANGRSALHHLAYMACRRGGLWSAENAIDCSMDKIVDFADDLVRIYSINKKLLDREGLSAYRYYAENRMKRGAAEKKEKTLWENPEKDLEERLMKILEPELSVF